MNPVARFKQAQPDLVLGQVRLAVAAGRWNGSGIQSSSRKMRSNVGPPPRRWPRRHPGPPLHNPVRPDRPPHQSRHSRRRPASASPAGRNSVRRSARAWARIMFSFSSSVYAPSSHMHGVDVPQPVVAEGRGSCWPPAGRPSRRSSRDRLHDRQRPPPNSRPSLWPRSAGGQQEDGRQRAVQPFGVERVDEPRGVAQQRPAVAHHLGGRVLQPSGAHPVRTARGAMSPCLKLRGHVRILGDESRRTPPRASARPAADEWRGSSSSPTLHSGLVDSAWLSNGMTHSQPPSKMWCSVPSDMRKGSPYCSWEPPVWW